MLTIHNLYNLIISYIVEPLEATGDTQGMKLIKKEATDKYQDVKPFNFITIKDLSNYDILTSYIKGKSHEYKSDMDKIFMVLEGNV